MVNTGSESDIQLGISDLISFETTVMHSIIWRSRLFTDYFSKDCEDYFFMFFEHGVKAMSLIVFGFYKPVLYPLT